MVDVAGVIEDYAKGGDFKVQLQTIATTKGHASDHPVKDFLRAIVECTQPLDSDQDQNLVKDETNLILRQLGGLARLRDFQIAVAGLVCLLPTFHSNLKKNKMSEDFLTRAGRSKDLLSQAASFKEGWLINMPTSVMKSVIPHDFARLVHNFVAKVEMGELVLNSLLAYAAAEIKKQVEEVFQAAKACCPEVRQRFCCSEVGMGGDTSGAWCVT